MNSMLRASIITGGLVALACVASAQVGRDTLVRPAIPRLSGRPGTMLYVTVDGTRQGRFKGQSLAARWRNAVPATGFTYGVGAPRDARGLATGTRVHGPVVVTAAVGAASPQFFTAATTSENLKSVVLEFVRTDANGAEDVFFTVKLTNAMVSHFRQFIADVDGGGPAGQALLEEITFTFQRIEMSSVDGATSAMDVVGQ